MLTEKCLPKATVLRRLLYSTKTGFVPNSLMEPKSQTSQSILSKRNWPPIITPLNCIKPLWLKQAGLYLLMKEAIAARVNDGVLTVTLPKMAKARMSCGTSDRGEITSRLAPLAAILR